MLHVRSYSVRVKRRNLETVSSFRKNLQRRRVGGGGGGTTSSTASPSIGLGSDDGLNLSRASSLRSTRESRHKPATDRIDTSESNPKNYLIDDVDVNSGDGCDHSTITKPFSLDDVNKRDENGDDEQHTNQKQNYAMIKFNENDHSRFKSILYHSDDNNLDRKLKFSSQIHSKQSQQHRQSKRIDDFDWNRKKINQCNLKTDETISCDSDFVGVGITVDHHHDDQNDQDQDHLPPGEKFDLEKKKYQTRRSITSSFKRRFRLRLVPQSDTIHQISSSASIY
ncbi:hypothetical protein QR98_0070850 [Sarcoptes scabiei]|uniref:Uncharacterized protein n=1 Tax=Sarcoptes scabiei TaxID=52283 RepID=A0A132ACB5_SARSC|nr:hypothetical protein QR98_0070850 [Sarcoptes scabiei]